MRARAYGLCARVHVAAGRHPAAMGWLWDTLYSRSQSPPFSSEIALAPPLSPRVGAAAGARWGLGWLELPTATLYCYLDIQL